jgi:hypothetical protein
MKYHLREYHSLFLQSIIGKNKLKLKDVITSSICTIVNRTCYIFFIHDCGNEEAKYLNPFPAFPATKWQIGFNSLFKGLISSVK